MEIFNYEQNCRLCLKAHNASKNIFSHVVEGYQEPLVENIFSLFRVKLHSHKAYPQNICRKCLTEVESILLFKEDLVRNQEFLLGLFRAAFPGYVEKKTRDSRKMYAPHGNSTVNSPRSDDFAFGSESFAKPIVPETNVPHECLLAAIKHEADQIAKVEPDIKSHDRVQEENIAVRRTTRQSSKTDENKNVSTKHWPDQDIKPMGTDINENRCAVDNVAIPTTKGVRPAESLIPQASFLQNFNLITLRDAEILKTQQRPGSRTRRRSVPKKYKVSNASNNIPKVTNIITNPQSKAVSSRSKKTKSKKNSSDILVNRSVNFLSRYGFRKFSDTYLKRGKIIRKADQVLNCLQHEKAKVAPKHTDFPKDGKSSLGPNPLSKLTLNKSEAVSQQEGCENESNLSYKDPKQKIKVEIIENTINNNIDTKSANSITANQRTNNVSTTLKKTRLCSEKSRHLPSSSPSTQSNLSDDYSSIPSKYFYTFSTTSPNRTTYLPTKRAPKCGNKSDPIYQDKLGTLNKDSEYSTARQSNKKYSSVKTINPSDCSDFKIGLFRSPSLDSRSDFDHIDKNILSISDPPVPVSHHSTNEFPKNLTNVNLEQCPIQPKAPQPLHASKSPEIIRKSKRLSDVINRLEEQKSTQLPTKWRHEDPLTTLDPFQVISPPNSTKRKRGRPKNSVSNYFNESADSIKRETKIGSINPAAVISLPRTKNKLNNLPSSDSLDHTKVAVDATEKTNKTTRRKRAGLRTGSQLSNISERQKVVQPIKTEELGLSSNLPTDIKRPNHLVVKSEDFNLLDDLSIAQRIRIKREPLVTEERTSYSKITAAAIAPSSKPPITKTSNNITLYAVTASQNCNVSVSALQALNDRYEIDDNIGLRIKLRKTVSSESVNSLKFDTQEVEGEYSEAFKDFDHNPILNEYKVDQEQWLRRSLNKVCNVNVKEDQEIVLTLNQTNFMTDTVPEDMDYADLSEYPRNHPESYKPLEKRSICIENLDDHTQKQRNESHIKSNNKIDASSKRKKELSPINNKSMPTGRSRTPISLRNVATETDKRRSRSLSQTRPTLVKNVRRGRPPKSDNASDASKKSTTNKRK